MATSSASIGNSGAGAFGAPAALDAAEEPHQPTRFDQTALAHGGDILQILRVAAFDFGQCLRVEVVVVEIHHAVPRNEGAAFAPAGERRDEVVRRRQFHIHVEFLLGVGDGLEDAARFRVELEVHSHIRLPPANQNRRGAADQIDAPRPGGPFAQAAHEQTHLGGIADLVAHCNASWWRRQGEYVDGAGEVQAPAKRTNEPAETDHRPAPAATMAALGGKPGNHQWRLRGRKRRRAAWSPGYTTQRWRWLE